MDGRKVRGVDRYKRRKAPVVFVDESWMGYRTIGKGERLTIDAAGDTSGTFTVDDVSEPAADGSITLTLSELP